MSKKDEALKLALEALEVVTREMLALKDELAERGARPTTNVFHQRLWDSAFKAYTDRALPAAAAIREALADSALERMAENARELGLDYEAAQQQEPVGEAYLCDKCQTPFDGAYYCPECGHNTATKESVYTSPPASKPWVGLTSQEVYACADESGLPQELSTGDLQAFGQSIEAKLREKNA